MNDYPSYVQTDYEKVLWNQVRRADQVISAMQRRAARNPLRDLLWRRPWRSNHGPQSVRHFFQWIKNAHDCQDPAVGCSCQPSFRFPPLPPLEVDVTLAVPSRPTPLRNRIPRGGAA